MSAWILLLCLHMAGGRRARNSWNGGDIVDLAPLFEQVWQSFPEYNYTYNFQDKTLKCCCYRNSCKLGDVNANNICREYSPLSRARNPYGCGCVVGSGYKSFHNSDGGCTMPIEEATQALTSFHPKHTPTNTIDLLSSVQDAKVTRMVDGWKVSYGECSTSCGMGFRSKIGQECLAGECGPYDESKIKDQLPCQELTSCWWTCTEALSGCGWGRVGCTGGDQRFCALREAYEVDFPRKADFEFSTCFQTCTDGDALHSMCAITSNHLDEQYQSLSNLLEKTCFSGRGADEKPDVVVLMTQELNHLGSHMDRSNNFEKYVGADSLADYARVGHCTPHMSANSAVFVRTSVTSHVFQATVHCSGTDLRSTCSGTNCKGTSVMGLYTTAGYLVVGNWHGARAGTESETRIREFEQAVAYISNMPEFLGRKLVVFGGDTNVRSKFPEGFAINGDLPQHLPQQIWEVVQLDVLGSADWTVDQHLRGEVGIDESVMRSLQKAPLKQVKDWNKLCPTYRKTSNSTYDEAFRAAAGKGRLGFQKYEKGIRQLPNLKCRTPAEQMADQRESEEFLDMKMPGGSKSRAPSWTERIFLSEDLFNSCGKAKKDTRNPQTDHDPMYVQCSMPFLGPYEA